MSTFTSRKANILSSLAQPDATYTDASPKGSIDALIRDLITEINSYNLLVTTSSCSGRVSVFVEGSGKRAKGHGGRWLFVSHTPLDLQAGDNTGAVNEIEGSEVSHVFTEGTENSGRWHTLFGLTPAPETETDPSTEYTRYIHLKFEPLILHVLCASASAANTLLKVAQQAGFRESGAMNVPSSSIVSNPRSDEADCEGTVNVAIRTTGLALDSIIGFVGDGEGVCHSLVTERHLHVLIRISNARFVINSERMERLRGGLVAALGGGSPQEEHNRVKREDEWEDKNVRAERMRKEGLERRARMGPNGGVSKEDGRDMEEEGGNGLGLGLFEEG